MKLLNQHERRLRSPLHAVFAELAALGTAADRIWPEPAMPFRRTEGPMRTGHTHERHGAIRAVLQTYRANELIVWRAELPFLRGTHAFEVSDLGEGATLVRHVLRAELTWWFGLVWRLRIGSLHDRIIESMFDRLEAVLTRHPQAEAA